jgi:uncharacterized repeat protein (TIGR01451 family)
MGIRRWICRPWALQLILTGAIAAVVALAAAPLYGTALAAEPYVGSPIPITGVQTFGPTSPKWQLDKCDKGFKEAEVSLAADPRDSDQLVAAWVSLIQETRLTTPDSTNYTVLTASSDNGGRTWHPAWIPGIDRCTGTDQQAIGAINTFASIGVDGVRYLSSLGGYETPQPPPLPPRDGHDVQANWCCNADGSWSQVAVVDDHNDSETQHNDFPPVVADPAVPGRAYIVYGHDLDFVFMSRTDDGGNTWTDPAPVIEGAQTPQLVVLRDETPSPPLCSRSCRMLIVFQAPPSGAIYAIRSENGGSTWSAPLPLGLTPAPPATAVPGVAAAGDDIYVTSANSARVELVHSDDQGESWDPPVTVSEARDTVGRNKALKGPGPDVAVDASGRVGVLWYDTRNDDDPLTTPTPTDVWFTYSDDGGARWPTEHEKHVAGPFDHDQAFSNGTPFKFCCAFTLGGYFGLIPLSDDGFGAAFPLLSPLAGASYPSPEPALTSDIYYTHITDRALSLTSADFPDPVSVGGVLTYTLEVTNNSSSSASSVTLTDLLDEGVRIRSARSDHGRCAQRTPRRIECNLAELQGGETATVTIAVRPLRQTAMGTIGNSATVRSDPVDGNPVSDTTTETTKIIG